MPCASRIPLEAELGGEAYNRGFADTRRFSEPRCGHNAALSKFSLMYFAILVCPLENSPRFCSIRDKISLSIVEILSDFRLFCLAFEMISKKRNFASAFAFFHESRPPCLITDRKTVRFMFTVLNVVSFMHQRLQIFDFTACQVPP
jgi:hypothetical protein